MPKFIMLCRGGDLKPEQRGPHMQKWGAWMGQLASSGKLVAGEPFQPGGKVVSDHGKKVTDYKPGPDSVTGYIIVNAKDTGDAAEISKGCPLLEIGGNLEIRELMQVGP